MNEQSDDSNIEQDESPDFAQGLSQMLASLYAHTSSNVLSATIARKLLSHGERFMFSHDFIHIPLKHMLAWIDNEEDLEFKLRVVKTSDGVYDHV